MGFNGHILEVNVLISEGRMLDLEERTVLTNFSLLRALKTEIKILQFSLNLKMFLPFTAESRVFTN